MNYTAYLKSHLTVCHLNTVVTLLTERSYRLCYCRALAIRRESSTLQLLGVLYYNNKQLREAELAWGEALVLEPTNTETRSNYVSKMLILSAIF